MANTQSVIELVFQGTDKTGAAVQSALSNTSKFASNVQAATQPIADFTAGALKIEAALLASGAAITAFSVKVAGDFDTAFREISTLISAPVEDLDSFKAAILSYASSSTKPLEEVTQSIYNAISAGVDYADAIEAVAIAEQLSVAGKATLNDSLLVLVSSLNAYGLGMEDAQRFSDALFTTVKQGQTTLPELANSLSGVTGLAATAGVSFEELLAAVATLTSTGAPTSQAVTQIQGAISAILKPTSEASALAKQLGIDFSLQRLEAVGLSGVLNDVQAATGGNAEQMAVLFGRVEALNGVLTLTGLGADKFAETLQAMASNAGSVEVAFAIMVQSIDASSQKIKNALDGLFIAIGAPLLDEFSGVAEAIAGIFNAIGDAARDNDSGIGQLVQYIESQFGGLQDTLEEVARNLPAALELADFSGFTSGLEAVTGAISDLFSGIDLSTAEGLAEAITLIGQAFNGLSQFTAGVIDSLKPLFSQITEIAGGLKDLDEEFFNSLGNMAGFATQANALAGALTNMVPAVQGLIAVIGINQTAGLVRSFAAAGSALTGSTGLLSLLGQAGLVGAAGGAGFALGTLADDAVRLATGTSLSTWAIDAAAKLGLIDDSAYDIVEGLNNVREQVEKPPSTSGINDALEDIIVTAQRLDSGLFSGPLTEIEVSATRMKNALDGQADSLGGIITIYDDATGKVIGYTDGVSNAADAMDGVITLYDDATGKVTGYTDGLSNASDIMQGIIPIYDEATGKITGYTDGVSSAADIMGYVYDSSVEAAAGIEKFGAAGENISIDEKLALIDGQVKVTVANIEAGAKIMTSAFESVNTGIESTGDLLGSLFGDLNDADNFRDRFKIEDQIKLENERRQKELNLQEKLINSQLRLNAAREKAFKAGGMDLKVSGDGLQPHLEAFMWEILGAIQVRVNADGYEMLLGGP